MADAKEDSMYESARLNLLEVIEERNRALNRVRENGPNDVILTIVSSGLACHHEVD